MTVDELVRITEILTGDLNLLGLISGEHKERLERFTADDLAILVRFLAGERPTVLDKANLVPSPLGPMIMTPEREAALAAIWDEQPQPPDDGAKRAHERLRQQISRTLPDDDDEVYEPPRPAGKKAAERTKDGLAGLGEFDGIVLP